MPPPNEAIPVPATHFATRPRSICGLLRHRESGRRMQWDSDGLHLGRLRCVADRDEFPSIPAIEEPDDEGDEPRQQQAPANPMPPTYCLRFCPVPGSHELLGIANEDGRVAFQDTSIAARMKEYGKRPKEPVHAIQLHKNAIYDLDWRPTDAAVFATASGDQTARVWSIPEAGGGDQMKEVKACSHEKSVKSVRFCPDNPFVLATGSRDGAIRVWDTRTAGSAKSENVIRPAHGARGKVTDLVFLDNHSLLSSGDNDGVVKQWDLRRAYSRFKRDPLPRYRFLHPGTSGINGFTSLRVDPHGRFLYASCMDSSIYQFNLSTREERPDRRLVGADLSNFYLRMAVSPDGRYVASGAAAGDCTVHVWNVELTNDSRADAHPVARLTGHDVEVTCVDWCGTGWKLASCGDDVKHRLWELDPGSLGENAEAAVRREESGVEYYAGEVEMTPPTFVDKGPMRLQRGGFLAAPQRYKEEKQLEIKKTFAKRPSSSAAAGMLSPLLRTPGLKTGFKRKARSSKSSPSSPKILRFLEKAPKRLKITPSPLSEHNR